MTTPCRLTEAEEIIDDYHQTRIHDELRERSGVCFHVQRMGQGQRT